jgi:hypothetical protein
MARRVSTCDLSRVTGPRSAMAEAARVGVASLITASAAGEGAGAKPLANRTRASLIVVALGGERAGRTRFQVRARSSLNESRER